TAGIRASIAAMPHTVQNFVGGASVASRADTAFDLVDPTDERVYGTSPVSTAADVDAAFTAASTAFETWRRTTPGERQLALFRIADAMEQRASEFADLESLDTGKPRATLVEDEILLSVDQIRFFAGAARNL
ncbi:aldehyde dehydrogenase family protein, partial [Mycobacteroides abscessus]|uniref:aldehyde dehydrogenase family protein n=1 Tax=Mycobacteroides abscessus TaxID=36809 RepID=UPI001A96B4DD